jgi:hypothetical protein
MSISNQVKEMLRSHKAEIELLQLAMTSSLAGLLYSEFIRNFKQVLRPVHKIFIPELKQVRDLVNPDSEFMINISDNIVDSIINNELFKEFSSIDDLSLFKPDNIEILKTVVDLYIIPNMARSIPAVIASKFSIGNDDNQFFIESNEIDLFRRESLGSNHFKYIVDETILNILSIIPKIEREIVYPDNNMDITLDKDDKTILTIGNDNAITLLHFNKQIFDNLEIMNLLSFVTSTSIGPKDNNKLPVTKYTVITNPYNQVMISKISIPAPVQE